MPLAYRRDQRAVGTVHAFLHLSGDIHRLSIKDDLSAERLGKLELVVMHIHRGHGARQKLCV